MAAQPVSHTFNPLALPKGMKASADPVLLARPAPCGVSLGRRLTETAAKSGNGSVALP